MSIFNRLIIEFLKEKNKLINDKFGEDMGYIYDDDIHEVEAWQSWQCVAVLDNLYIRKDLHSCPWCILNIIIGVSGNPKNCMVCEYGQRHGKCNRGGDTYGKITQKGNTSICSIPGLVKLILKTLKNYDKILKKLDQMPS